MPAANRTTTSPPPSPTTSIIAALRIPRYPYLWASGALWHTSRWGLAFLAAYYARSVSESPRLVQLTGVAMWMPLLVGGVIGGIVSDRFDRRRTLLVQLAALIPLVAFAGILIITDTMRLWMIYPFMVVVGLGWIVDMTSRRAFIYDIAGPARIDNAMALESFAMAIGMTSGTLFGGSAIEAIGMGAAFLGIAGLLLVALLLFLRVPDVRGGAAPAVSPVARSPIAQVRDGFGLLGQYRGLVSILGVTALVNFFYFAYTPLVQVIGKNLGAGPGRVGLLAAMGGFGMMTSAFVIARGRLRRRGLAYCTGSFVSFGFLVVVAQSRTYGLTLVALAIAGVGVGFFGATQSTLVMVSVPVEVRGRALGLLSTAIGVLPLGMILLGEIAEASSARTALTVSAVIGGSGLVLWLLRRPDVLRMRSDTIQPVTTAAGAAPTGSARPAGASPGS